MLESEYSGSEKNASPTSAPASRDRKRKSSDGNGDNCKKSPAATPTHSATKRSKENKSSRKSADVEAAQLRAKAFFDTVSVDLSSDIDEPSVSADKMSDAEGNRDETSSGASDISEIKVLPEIKDTQRSSHTSRTPLSGPLHSNRHADTPQVRMGSTSHPTSLIKSPITASSTPVTKKALPTTPENNYQVPVSPIYHHESQVTHQRNSYMDLLCEDEDSSSQNLPTLLSSAIRQSYDVESPQGARHIEKPLKASSNSCPDCALYKARNEELEARLNELEDKCQCKNFY